MQFISNTTIHLLDEWVVWSRDNTFKSLNYPSWATFTVVKQRKPVKMSLTDEQAMEIDMIVARMRKKDQQTGDAVLLYLFSDSNLRYVSRQLKINTNKSSVLIKSGIAWIDAMLEKSEVFHAGSLECLDNK